jgi:hypothetical protein
MLAAGGVYEKVKSIEQQVTELAHYLEGKGYDSSGKGAAKGMGKFDGMFDDEEDMGEHGPSSDLAIEPDAEDTAEAEQNLMAKTAEEGNFKTNNSLKSSSPSSNASSPSASDAPEDEKSQKETALEEVNTECLKIDSDKRLQCCQAECKKFGTRFNVTEQVQVTCMKPCMNAKSTTDEEKASFAELKEPHHGIKRRDQEQRVDLGGGISMDLEKDAGASTQASEGVGHKDSRKGRDKEQGLDIGGGLFMNIEKHAGAAAAKDAEAGEVAEQKEADAEANDSRKGRDKEQGLDIGGGLFFDIPIARAA